MECQWKIKEERQLSSLAASSQLLPSRLRHLPPSSSSHPSYLISSVPPASLHPSYLLPSFSPPSLPPAFFHPSYLQPPSLLPSLPSSSTAIALAQPPSSSRALSIPRPRIPPPPTPPSKCLDGYPSPDGPPIPSWNEFPRYLTSCRIFTAPTVGPDPVGHGYGGTQGEAPSQALCELHRAGGVLGASDAPGRLGSRGGRRSNVSSARCCVRSGESTELSLSLPLS